MKKKNAAKNKRDSIDNLKRIRSIFDINCHLLKLFI